MRLGRIAAGFAQGAPLAQKIPALIQLHLNVCQALALVRSELALLEQPVLLSYQALNMSEHGLVLTMFFHGVPRWMQKGVGDAQHRPVMKIRQALRLSSAWPGLGGSYPRAQWWRPSFHGFAPSP